MSEVVVIKQWHTLSAKKTHICNVCLTSINKGNSYFGQFNKIDDVFAWKECAPCRRLIDMLYEIIHWHVYEDDFMPDIFLEQIHEINDYLGLKSKLKPHVTQYLERAKSQ